MKERINLQIWLALFGLGLALWLVVTYLREILAIGWILFGANLLSLAIQPLAKRLSRYHIPRGVTVILTYTAGVLLLVGGQVRIPAMPQPKYDSVSAQEVVQLAVDWENEVTGQINSLMDMAIGENDHIAQGFLRLFVTEQLEEVSTMETLLKTIHRAGDNLLWVEDFLSQTPLGQTQSTSAPEPTAA